MDFEAFSRSILETGAYRTPESIRRGIPARLLGGRAWWFYAQVLATVIHGRFVSAGRKFGRRQWAYHAFLMMRAAERAGGSVTMEGMNALRSGPWPVVVAANHMSMLETMILPCPVMLYGDVSVVVKESLKHYPLFGHILRQTRPIFVSRRDPRTDLKTVLSEGEKLLSEGRSIVIFPQATRRPWFDSSEFNTMAVKLARRAAVPVVPVALQTDFQGIGRFLRDFGPLDRTRPIRFKMGNPIPVTGNGREAHREVLRFIEAAFREWGLDVRSGPEQERREEYLPEAAQ